MPPRHAQVAPGGPGGIWRILTTRRLRGDRPRRVTQALGSEPRWVTQIPDRSYVSKNLYKRCIPVTIDDLKLTMPISLHMLLKIDLSACSEKG